MTKVRRVALILDTARAYQRKIIRGVAAYAQQAGNWILYMEEDPLDKLPSLRTWQGHGIITTFTERRYAKAVRGLQLPVVGVEGGYCWYEDDSGIPYFSTDDTAIGIMAAEHLMAQGYANLAYCGLPKNRYNLWSLKRGRAFKQHARQAGVPCYLYTGRHISTRKWTELQEGLCRWLQALKKPVGIMAGSDARARHVLEACRTIGVRVPEDVAVMGVNNDELMCELTSPPLTSIEQGARELGFRAAELLDRMMSGKKPKELANYVRPERLVTRRSTDYLAIGDSDVAAAVQFIRQHACKHIHVDDVTQAIAVSRSTLEVKFRKIMHKSLHDEIQQTMLRRAQELMMDDNLTLAQVAKEAGFAHAQHLSNLFRQHFGLTPRDFQRNIRLGSATDRVPTT